MLKLSVLLLCCTSLLGVVYCQGDANSLAYMTQLMSEREQQLIAIRSLSLKVSRICPEKPLDDIEVCTSLYLKKHGYKSFSLIVITLLSATNLSHIQTH